MNNPLYKKTAPYNGLGNMTADKYEINNKALLFYATLSKQLVKHGNYFFESGKAKEVFDLFIDSTKTIPIVDK